MMDLSIPTCVLSLLLLGFSYAQEIVIFQPVDKDEVTMKTGNYSFTWKCKATGLADGESAGLEWLDPNNKVIGKFTNREGIREKRMYIIVVGTELWLQVTTVQDGDEGRYTCRGNINGNQVEKDIGLKLYEPIKVHSPTFQQPIIFTDAQIKCNATAKPNPTIVWFYGGNMTVIKSGDGTRYRPNKKGLVIQNITQADNGQYVCMVSAPKQSNTVPFRITVEVTIPPKMKGLPTASDPIVGQKFTMSCEANGTPPPKFVFKKGGTELTGERYQVSVENGPLFETGTLVIEKLEDSDEGVYMCEAFNLGGRVSEIVNIDTIVPPVIEAIHNKTAAEGSTVELVCVARSDPPADVQWQITGTDISISTDPTLGIIIDTESKEEPLIHIVTKRLRFSNLKPINTNNYTCTASNIAGTDSKDGKVIVEFKPNFDNTPYSSTYGWENHDTEIKCVVDAVPYPSITWQHNKEKITANSVFTISQKKGVRQLTGILTVKVDPGNVQTIFGTYTCAAVNMHGDAAHDIVLHKAVRPGVPEVEVSSEEITPTTIELLITPPANNGGQPIIDYKIVYQEEGKKTTEKTRKADTSSDPSEPRTRYVIDQLQAKTKYIINVAARNAVDYGAESTVSETTTSRQKPGVPTITSTSASDNANTYSLRWQITQTGGAPLTGYNIKYTQVKVEDKGGVQTVVNVIGKMQTARVNQGKASSHTLKGLMPNAHYEVELTAINSIGESLAAKRIFQTAKGGMATPTVEILGNVDMYLPGFEAPMATGAIIGILIAVIIILFIVIDVTFYFTKQCGLLWTLKGKVAGGDPGGEGADEEAADHEKEAFIKEGKQDSEEPSAKENVDVVNETEKGGEDTKDKELEPEDKEDKVTTEPTPEPAEEAKEATPPAGSPQTESAPPETTTEPAPEAAAPDIPEKDPKV